MPRTNRWLEPGAFYHVMNRGVEGRNVFMDDLDRLEFLTFVEGIYESFNCQIVAYCLMGNHFHLIVKDSEAQLSSAMKMLSLRYVRHFNLRYGRDGPLFRGRFKSVRLLDEHQLRATIEYVHFNPVKDQLVTDPSLWKWSSFQFYEGRDFFPKWMIHGLINPSEWSGRKYKVKSLESLS